MGSYGSLLLPLALFVAMYFLLIVPNQRKQKQWAASLAQLKVGDRITTTGGVRGSIERVKDDALVIKTQPDGIRLEIVKSAVASVTTDDTAAKS